MQDEVIVVEAPVIEEAANPENEAVAAEFEEVKADVAAGREPSRSVRELLRWFGARRRRGGVVERIEAELEAAGLRTDPHFTTTWIDAPVIFRKREAQAPAADAAPVVAPQAGADAVEAAKPADVAELTHLVRMLEAANREVISVNPQDPIERAVTLMLAYDFSQLAVMTGPRDLKGAISWKSIGSRLSQRNALTNVSDAMEKATEVSDADSLFEVTKTIIQRDFVFVRAADRKITGIVTATDLSEQFQRLSEPFLLLGRIENQIRRLIQDVFDVDTLRAACNDNDPDRKAAVTKASQLTFGEYQRIFENEANWAKLGFVACRKTFCKELDEVRKLRNEIMHFHPDVIEDGDFEQLRRFSRLLEQLDQLAG
ncbi:HPP family protein [Niveispirillum fermenti]|uniref:CBS domain-containing protein n=1 Tax=Niveispirillum fermenti TaxID=1233113 RepID=UPI003A880ED2